MNFHSLSVGLGWMAVILGVFATYAQLGRVSRFGVGGVSLATWVLFVYMGSFWITYGVVARSWEVIFGSLLVLPMQLALLFRLRPWRHLRVVAQAFSFFFVTCVVPTMLWGWLGGVYGTGVAMTMNRGPQLLELLREPDASGVSAGSWAVGAIGAVLWVVYYVGDHLWAALVSTAFAGVANAAIAVLAVWRHRQARQNLIRDTVFVA